MFKREPRGYVDVILKNIEQNQPFCRSAILQFHTLSSVQVERLAQALRTNTHLEYLNLQDCFLTDPQLLLLLPAIKSNVALKTIAIELAENYADPVLQQLSLDVQDRIVADNGGGLHHGVSSV